MNTIGKRFEVVCGLAAFKECGPLGRSGEDQMFLQIANFAELLEQAITVDGTARAGNTNNQPQKASWRLRLFGKPNKTLNCTLIFRTPRGYNSSLVNQLRKWFCGIVNFRTQASWVSII